MFGIMEEIIKGLKRRIMMRKDELENASQEQQKMNIEEKTKIIKRLIDKNIDVFKRLAKK